MKNQHSAVEETLEGVLRTIVRAQSASGTQTPDTLSCSGEIYPGAITCGEVWSGFALAGVPLPHFASCETYRQELSRAAAAVHLEYVPSQSTCSQAATPPKLCGVCGSEWSQAAFELRTVLGLADDCDRCIRWFAGLPAAAVARYSRTSPVIREVTHVA